MRENLLTVVVNDKIWTLVRPVWFGGVRLRARTTAVRLGDGGLLLHTPAPMTDALVEQLRSLGPVRWLVVPNCFHHLATPAAAARFPDARVVGPASALKRNVALKFHVDIRDSRFGEQLPEIEALPLEGVPFLDETVLYHRPTNTLLGADLVLGANAKDHWTWRWAARVTGCYEQVRVPPDVRKKIHFEVQVRCPRTNESPEPAREPERGARAPSGSGRLLGASARSRERGWMSLMPSAHGEGRLL